MKKKIVLMVLSLCFLFAMSLTVTSCSLFPHSVTVEYNTEQGVIEGTGKYKKGKEVTLKAIPYDGFVFDCWTEHGVGNFFEETYTFKMGSKNKKLFAYFKEDTTKRDLTINYLFENGETASETVVLSLAYGETYEVLSPILTGYNCDTEVVSGSMKYEDTITVNYIRKNYLLKVNSLLNGNALPEEYQRSAELKYLDNYNFSLQQYDYYLPTVSTVSGKVIDTNQEVSAQLDQEIININVNYAPKMYTLKVNCVNNGKILKNAFERVVSYTDNYSVTMPSIEHYYTLTNKVEGKINSQNTAVSSQLDGNEIVINVEYVAKPILTIEYKYSNNSTAYTTYQKEFDYNANYNVTSPKIIGFTPNNAVISGTITQNTKLSVIYTANQYSYTIKYLNEQNQSVATTKNGTITYGDSYEFVAPSVNNYVYITEKINGIFNENDSVFGQGITEDKTSFEYVFEYLSLERTINIYYKDTQQNVIKATESFVKNVGESYTVDSPVIVGYTANQTNVSGIVPAEKGFSVTLYYTIKQPILTINYLDERDNSVVYQSYSSKVTYNSNYSINSPEVAGYTCNTPVVNGVMGENDYTINVTYKPIQYYLTINYLNDKNESIAQQYKNKFEYKAEYSVSLPTVNSGYVVPNEYAYGVTGTMGVGDVTINIVYLRKISILTVNYLSSLSGFDSVKPTSKTFELKYEQAYSVTSPALYGLKADKLIVEGTMGAEDKTENVNYTSYEMPITVNINLAGTKLTSITTKVSFTNQQSTVTFSNPLIVNGLGYKVEYQSLTVSIANNNFVCSATNNSSSENLTVQIAGDKTYATVDVNATEIKSVLTVIHRLDNSTALKTDTYEKIYGQSVTVGYEDFEDGYVPAGTNMVTHEFTAEDKTIYFEYSSKLLSLTIYYVNDMGKNVAPTYTATYKYKQSYSITSPTDVEEYPSTAGYIPNLATVSGTVGINDITVVVTYKVNWATDPSSGELLISSASDLQKLSTIPNLWNRSIKFTQDIDMSGISIAPIGNSDNPFKGVINGNGKTISNLSFDSSKIKIKQNTINNTIYKTAYVGLFGCATDVISNLTISNATISLEFEQTDINVICGILVGQYTGTEITNVTVSGSISYTQNQLTVGGLAGVNMSGTISNCSSTVTITTNTGDYTDTVGGIVGENVKGTVSSCSATLNASQFEVVGAIVGVSSDGFITEYTIGETSQIINVCGENNGTIIN